ncbi:MAG: hypothetical protein IPM84_06070 [Anaerolineae bacterium]|nr:hypothetical protein [Anaerolineae bacterium]
MRNIICLLLGHRWHLERREQHYGIVETITVCDRCGDHCLGTFDAETGQRNLLFGTPPARP